MKKLIFTFLMFWAILSPSQAKAYYYPPYVHTGIWAGVPVGYGYFYYGYWPVTWVPYGYSYYPYYNYAPYYSTFGSISYSPSTGRVGVAWGKASQYDAEWGSNYYCGANDCRSIVWVQGGCAAIALNSKTKRFGWAYSDSRWNANNAALRACGLQGDPANCQVEGWVCSF